MMIVVGIVMTAEVAAEIAEVVAAVVTDAAAVAAEIAEVVAVAEGTNPLAPNGGIKKKDIKFEITRKII
jgi:hypothetical protein